MDNKERFDKEVLKASEDHVARNAIDVLKFLNNVPTDKKVLGPDTDRIQTAASNFLQDYFKGSK